MCGVARSVESVVYVWGYMIDHGVGEERRYVLVAVDSLAAAGAVIDPRIEDVLLRWSCVRRLALLAMRVLPGDRLHLPVG